MTIDYLANHEGCIPQLAQYSYDEWRPVYDQLGLTVDNAVASYRERTNIEALPLALVAIEHDQVIGTGALKLRDLVSRPQYEPWLGGLFVVPEFRRRGVGTALVHRLVAEALRLRLPQLYLWTPSAESLYARLGWGKVEALCYCGYEIVVMKKRVSAVTNYERG